MNINGNAYITAHSTNGPSYGISVMDNSNVNAFGDIEIDAKNVNGDSYGVFLSSSLMDAKNGFYKINVSSNRNSYGWVSLANSATHIEGLFDVSVESKDRYAYGLYLSQSKDSINSTGNSRWTVHSGSGWAYGIFTTGGNDLTLTGNHQFDVESTSSTAYGILGNNQGNIKQHGNFVLNVKGVNPTGIYFRGPNNSIELENITATITTTNSSDNAYGISTEAGNPASPSALVISGDSNTIAMNGIGIHANNGFLNAILSNTEVKSTVDRGFEVKNSSILNLNADNSHFIGNSVVDVSSTFNLSLLNNSRWDIKTDSNVTNLTNQSSSIVDLTNDDSSQYNELIVEGDYIGGDQKPTSSNPSPNENGLIIVNTLWNNTDSLSDTVLIKGTAEGYTEIKTKSGIIGNVANDGSEKYSADVIIVDNHYANSNAFYGFADTAGAG